MLDGTARHAPRGTRVDRRWPVDYGDGMQEPTTVNRPGRNIELKCRCDDLEAVRRKAEQLGARDMGLLHQRDTFFQAPRARLKLRELGEGKAELISYRRPDTVEARGSDYVICAVAHPVELAAVLEHALGTGGTVKKQRHLFLHGHTRIHLDEVEGLGSFIELETVLSGQTDQEALRELEQIVVALGLDGMERVPVPYLELLDRTAR
jgi:adenylate cyclase, class 2